MKKKTLLSLLTGIAIVASTAGTYAAWDKVSQSIDTGDNNIKFNQPVTINLADSQKLEFNVSNDLATSNDQDTTPSATSKAVTFNVSDPSHKANTLSVSAKIDDTTDPTQGTKGDVTDQYNITLTPQSSVSGLTPANSDSDPLKGKGLTETIDSSKISTEFSPSYNVKITPVNSSQSSIGHNLKVTLTGTLSKSAAPTT